MWLAGGSANSRRGVWHGRPRALEFLSGVQETGVFRGIGGVGPVEPLDQRPYSPVGEITWDGIVSPVVLDRFLEGI